VCANLVALEGKQPSVAEEVEDEERQRHQNDAKYDPVDEKRADSQDQRG